MELILIRHGETIWNKEGKVQGFSDINLSDIGINQVQQLALSLKNHHIHSIYSSPLVRAHKTAQIINQYHNTPIFLESGLMEMDHGDFEGYSFQELMACEKDFLRKWMSDPASVKMPKGESFIELQTRAWNVIEDITAKQNNALIVSHNFTIASILCKIRNISLSEFRSVRVDNASRTVITFQNGSASIDVFNDRNHLTSIDGQ
ncbi:MAG: histidine phosphatase family protein [Syntrophales bacterium]